MEQKTLSKAEAKRLFNENAVYVGTNDILPLETAVNLFGKKPVEFTRQKALEKKAPGQYWNKCYFMGTGFEYLTEAGALLAASYYNLDIICRNQQALNRRGRRK